MKGWKLLLALGVVGVFVMPMMMEKSIGSSVQTSDLGVGGLTKASVNYNEPVTLSTESSSAGARFKAYVTNYGPSAVSSCRVYWYIDGERVASQSGPALSVDETKSVTSPTLYTSPGRHEVRVEIEPPIGYTDPNPSNNVDEGYFWFLS